MMIAVRPKECVQMSHKICGSRNALSPEKPQVLTCFFSRVSFSFVE